MKDRLNRDLLKQQVYGQGLDRWWGYGKGLLGRGLHRYLFIVLLGCLLLLNACSQETTDARGSSRYTSVSTIEITLDDDPEVLSREYGADILVWQPESGFAVVATDDVFSLVAQTAGNNNIEAITVPEAQAQAVWSYGWRAWVGGDRDDDDHDSDDDDAGNNHDDDYHAGHDETGVPHGFNENEAIWQQIALAEAHDLTPQLGAGIKIAVIDTGIDVTHPGLVDHLVDSSEWLDLVDDDDLPQASDALGASYGHGTAVAGIIIQVAPQAKILPIRVLDDNGVGDLSDVVLAIDWAITQGADIINLSLGGSQPEKALKEMQKYAKKQGVLIISAAGNQSQDSIMHPAAFSRDDKNAIGVGSVDLFDIKSVFSNYGKKLEMVAPGEDIFTFAPDEQMAFWSGTSFAAPIVSGVLALAIAELRLSDTLSRGDIEKLAEELLKRSDKIDDFNPDFKKLLGKGRLNAERFLLDVLP